MKARTLRRSITGPVLALLAIGFYYNVYRYPLQINSSGTSGTYSDTPGWLSAGKYLLVCLVLGYLLLLRLTRAGGVRVTRPLHVLAYAFLAGLPIVSAMAVQKFDFLLVGFFFIVAMLFHLFPGWRFSYRSANRFLAATVWIVIAVNLIQVLLFATVGRLPALAYRNSISVRFGSVLDDPNGFGILLAWLIPFAAAYFRGFARVVALSLLAVSLLITQSLTAVGALLAVCALMTLLHVVENPRALAPVVAIVGSLSALVGTAVYLYWTQLVTLYELYMITKKGSLAAHGNALTIFKDAQWINLAGLQPLVERWEETGYFNLLVYFGILYLAVYVAVGAWAALRYLRIYRDRTAPVAARTFAFGAIGLLVGVYLGNFLLPVISIFPLDLFTALLLGIASAGFVPEEAVAEAGRAAETPTAPRTHAA